MSQVKGTTIVEEQNHNELCKNEAEEVIEKLTKKVGKYVEQVCLEYLNDSNVQQKFQSRSTGLFGGFKRDNLSKDDENKFLNELRDKYNTMISNLVSTKIISVANLQSMNDSIIKDFSQSSLFKYYDSANWIEKLREKVKKLYE